MPGQPCVLVSYYPSPSWYHIRKFLICFDSMLIYLYEKYAYIQYDLVKYWNRKYFVMSKILGKIVIWFLYNILNLSLLKKNFGYLHTCTQWFPCKTEYNDKLRVDPKNYFKCIDMCILEWFPVITMKMYFKELSFLNTLYWYTNFKCFIKHIQCHICIKIYLIYFFSYHFSCYWGQYIFF